jgi:hypothetical protein
MISGTTWLPIASCHVQKPHGCPHGSHVQGDLIMRSVNQVETESRNISVIEEGLEKVVNNVVEMPAAIQPQTVAQPELRCENGVCALNWKPSKKAA